MMKSLNFALLLMLLEILPCNQGLAEHYKIWFKAFIPSGGLDIVSPVPNTPGHWMIPGPHIAGILIDTSCYNTNNRSFDSSVAAEAKITVIAEFDLLAPGIANFTKSVPDIGKTIRYNCDSGSVLKTGQASNHDVTVSGPTLNGGVVSFLVDADAANPLIALPPAMVPSIKIHGTVKVDPASRSIGFEGTIARFPSYEAYVSVDGKPPTAIFQIAPDSDATAWSLAFNNHINPTMPY